MGRRVVVRRVADRSAPRPKYADVVGTLLGADGSAVTVRTEDGTEVRVARADVHRVKLVPPSAAEMLELEEIAALGWRAPDSEWLGRWLLRAGGGWTGRANSVLPLGDPGHPLDDALTVVLDWYAERGQPARFQLPLPVRAPLDRALTDRGWTPYNHSQVLTAHVGELLRTVPEHPELPPVSLESRPTAEWLSGYHYRGGAGVPPAARAILADADRPVFASVRADGAVVAIARGVVDRGWTGVTAVEVDDRHRRRGLATHVMRALLVWAAEHGARASYLQVAEENAAGLGFYRRLGYAVHHRYRYLLGP